MYNKKYNCENKIKYFATINLFKISISRKN